MGTRRRGLALAAAALSLVAGIGLGARHWLLPQDRRPAAPIAAQLEVRVTAADGKPAANAMLTLTSGGKQQAARTCSTGVARFAALPRGPAHIEVSFNGAARSAQDLQLVPGKNRSILKLEPALELSGDVVDDAGQPVAAATIEARSETGSSIVLATQSDMQGHFLIADAATGRYAVEARAEHHDLAVLPGVQVPTPQPVRIVVQRASSLRGEVIGGDAKPAAGARVTIAGSGVWPPKAVETDEAGRFELSRIPGGVYELRATLGTWTSAPREGLVLQPAAEAFVSLQLEPGATLAGSVVDAETGAALIGVTVIVVEDGLASVPQSLTTAKGGEFAATGLRHLPQLLWIRAPGYVAIAGESRTPGEVAHEAFALRRAAVLEGDVVDERDAPVSSAELEVTGTTDLGAPMLVMPPVTESELAQGQHPSAIARLSGEDNLGVTLGSVPKIPLIAVPSGPGGVSTGFRSDARGHFRIDGVPAGNAQLLARHAGFALGRSEMRAIHTGEQVTGLRLRLPHGGTLSGRVLDGRGFPVSGVRVQVEVQGESPPRLALSAEDGRFRLDAVLGRCAVTAYPMDGPPVREQTEVDSGQTRGVVLQLTSDSRELSGRVHDARGFPIARAKVTVDAINTRAPLSRTATSGQDGTFKVAGLPAPPYRLVVDHPDYAPARLPSVSPEKQQEVSIELQPGSRIFGLVVDGMSNNGITGARVRLAGGVRGDQTARTSLKGEFEFRRLTTGKYDIFVDHERHISGHAKVSVTGAEARELDPVVLQPAGEVTGQVVDRLGAPVFDAEVALGTPPVWSHAVRSDHLGRFRLSDAPPGESWVSARHAQAGSMPEPVPVRVYPKQESPGLVLRLPGQR